MRIGIFVHLYNRSLFAEFCSYIDNVIAEFEQVVLLFTLTDDAAAKIFSMNVKAKYPNSHLIHIENKGTDLFSLMTQIIYLRENNIQLDYFLKLHTKMSDNSAEQLVQWRRQAVAPLTSPVHLKVIRHILSKTTVGYIAAQDCILPKSYDNDFPLNIKGIRQMTAQFKLPSDYLDFIAGTIFWYNMKIVDLYLTEEVIDELTSRFSAGKPPCNLTSKEIHVEYVLERLLTGPMCFNHTNVLINSNTAMERDVKYQPKLVSFHSPSQLMKLGLGQ